MNDGDTAEGYFIANVSPLRYLYQIDIATTMIGYILDRFWFDMLCLFVIGTIYRITAFLGLWFIVNRTGA